MHKLASKRKHGGKRPGAGRPKLDRRSVAARVDSRVFVELERRARAQKIRLGALIEHILTESITGQNGR